KAWPVRSAQCRPPSPPPPASPPASKAAPRRADRRPSPSAGSPARPRNTTEKPSSPSPPRQPRPLPSSTHPPPESEDHDRFSSSSICHANFQSIALTAKVVQLARLKSIAVTGAQVLVKEVFYRRFANRRQVGGSFGLAGTPYSNGEEERDQGISKAGNRRARTAAIELAWRWVLWQPDSELTPMVQRAGGRPQGSGETHRHRRSGAQTHGGAVALSRDWRRPRRRRALAEPLTGAPC